MKNQNIDKIKKLESPPKIVKIFSNKEINYVMTNAFGFGGNCTSLIYKKV